MFTTNSGRFISYYGREHTLDIQRQDGNNPTISTIDQLFNVLLNVWCKETAYPSCQKDYDYDNDPTYGQCAITASLVYDLFDGTIYKLKVDGGGTHYFNKINGHYIDLTSDQFDLYDIPLDNSFGNIGITLSYIYILVPLIIASWSNLEFSAT